MTMLINSLEKGENKMSLHVRRCAVCEVQLGQEHAMTSLARYKRETGSMITNTEMTCLRCLEEMVAIREFVEEEALVFGFDSGLFKQSIQPLLAHLEFSPVCLTPDTYSQHLEREIKQKQLYHCIHLPQNIRQLLYYSSFSIPQPERHERIRNTILRVMVECAIPLESLDDIAVLVQALFCFMSEASILQMFYCLRQASSDTLSFLNTSKEQLPSFDTQSHPNLWWSLYSGQSIKSLIKNIKVFLAAEQENKVVKSSKECEHCGKVIFNATFQLNTFRNHFYLIYEELLKEDEALREFIKQQELKFYKQKEEFINKIIRLKDRISLLEGEGMRARSASDGQISQIINDKYLKRASSFIQQRSQKSQGTIQTDRKMEEPFSPEKQEIKKESLYQTLTVLDLHPLLVSLPEFDPSLLSESVQPKQIILTIQTSISRLLADYNLLQKKCHQHQLQAKRLLSILTRKEEQFIPLIHEKDEIIEKYENAIWRMQNNLLIEDQNLKPRIDQIIKIFTNNILEAQSQLTQEERKESKKKSEKKEKRKKQQSEKQCCIY